MVTKGRPNGKNIWLSCRSQTSHLIQTLIQSFLLFTFIYNHILHSWFLHSSYSSTVIDSFMLRGITRHTIRRRHAYEVKIASTSWSFIFIDYQKLYCGICVLTETRTQCLSNTLIYIRTHTCVHSKRHTYTHTQIYTKAYSTSHCCGNKTKTRKYQSTWESKQQLIHKLQKRHNSGQEVKTTQLKQARLLQGPPGPVEHCGKALFEAYIELTSCLCCCAHAAWSVSGDGCWCCEDGFSSCELFQEGYIGVTAGCHLLPKDCVASEEYIYPKKQHCNNRNNNMSNSGFTASCGGI